MELELKFKVEEDWSDVIASRGYELIKQSHQVDRYFLCGDIIEERNIYLRIRENLLKNEYSFDFHEVLSFLATKETEMVLADAKSVEQMIYILNGIGLKIKCTIDKQRKIFENGEVKIAVDYVDGLGHFVEIEIDGEETPENQKKLEKLAEDLGLQNDKLVIGKGYPDLWMIAHSC